MTFQDHKGAGSTFASVHLLVREASRGGRGGEEGKALDEICRGKCLAWSRQSFIKVNWPVERTRSAPPSITCPIVSPESASGRKTSRQGPCLFITHPPGGLRGAVKAAHLWGLWQDDASGGGTSSMLTVNKIKRADSSFCADISGVVNDNIPGAGPLSRSRYFKISKKITAKANVAFSSQHVCVNGVV